MDSYLVLYWGSILLRLTKIGKDFGLLCLLIDAHLRLVLAKFEVIAAIFEQEINKYPGGKTMRPHAA